MVAIFALDNEEDSSLSEELASSRLVRSADARRRKGKKTRKGKKGRKGRKGRKGKKGKKGRKGKTGKKGRKNQSGSRSSGRADSDACLETSVNIMKMWKDVISNFEKQHKRMAKQNGTGESKSGKKGVFKSAAQRLLSVGGGNKSALSCAGATDNPGAAQMKNLTDFLLACEDSIHTACNATNFDLVNVTKLEKCKVVAEDFKTGAGECLGKSVGADKTTTDDACACWTNPNLDETIQAAKECKFNEESKAFAAALKTCKNKFSECRKYEDEVANSILACKSQEQLETPATTVAAGETTVAAGQTTVAAGETTVAAGQTTVAAGQTTVAAGQTTVSAGQTTTAAGQTTTAAGQTTVAAGQTTAAGGAGLYIFSLHCNAPHHLMIFHFTMRNELTKR